jgi:hypothetical protein
MTELLKWIAVAVVLLLARAAGEGDGGRRMWLLPVGEAPPFRQVVEDGIRKELPPPPGSLPPRAVRLRAAEVAGDEGADEQGEEAGGDEGEKPVVLALGRLTAPLQVPGGQRSMRVFESGGNDEQATPWLEFTTPEEGDFVVVVWRTGESWAEVASKVLPGGLMAGAVVFFNASPASVGMHWQGGKPGLKPGQVLRSELDESAPVPLVVSVVEQGGRPRRLARRSLEQGRGEASLVVFFRADGWRPRAPVNMVVVRSKTGP